MATPTAGRVLRRIVIRILDPRGGLVPTDGSSLTGDVSCLLEAFLTKAELIARLNDDLAGELGAIIQYITYAARATGPYRPQLSQFFLAEVADEQLHAQYLANKIVALGGDPTTRARDVPLPPTNRGMLEEVLRAEREAMEGYVRRAEEADAFGDKGLVVQLEDFVRDESGHVDETDRILRDWPL